MKDTNDDLSLIQQVAELHDKTAFDRLVRKYQSPIRRFFLHQTLGDAQLSDDLLIPASGRFAARRRSPHGSSA